jgi:type I restriction enzyme R subunit
VARGAELVVPEHAELREVYQQAQFEREIVVPDRTRVLCADLVAKLRTWGARDKTMVFCVTVEHADLVRAELQTALGPEVGSNLYAVRIVSEERDAQLLLEDFQRSTSVGPVVATTVDLLSTGVDIPSVRNIVFMKAVASPTLFKQIVGRGSRIDEATGKLFFRIIDYTNATRLFDSWDTPGAPPSPVEPGNESLRGRVIEATDGSPVSGAVVAVLVGSQERQALQTAEDGSFEAVGLPASVLRVLVSAGGFARTRRTLHPALGGGFDDLVVELHEASPTAEVVRISGVEVHVSDETTLVLDDSGSRLTVEQYCDLAGDRVRTLAGDTVSLGEVWRDPTTRGRLLAQLQENNVDPALLSLVLERPDADEYDLLAHVGFDARIRTREERARELEQFDFDFLSRFTDGQRDVVAALLDKYRLAGVDEVSTGKVFLLEPFLSRHGGLSGVAELFGGPDGVSELLVSIQAHLYPTGASAA